MEYRVMLRWKDDGSIETFSNRSKRMDEIANEYDEYMTDGGSGFGMGWRDMDWQFSHLDIAQQCMSKMQATLMQLWADPQLLESQWWQRTIPDSDWEQGWRPEDIEIYIVEIEPTEDLE